MKFLVLFWAMQIAVANSRNFISVLTKSGFALEPDEECSMTTPQLIKKHGYTVEEHRVKTEDGYILTMFRIPRGKNGRSGKEVVFLQHCLLCSSNDWLIQPAKDALPLLLADLGYDVWIGNNRGNSYAMEHETLKPNESAFWDFGFHELGVYDLPASFSYVIEHTDRIKDSDKLTGQISYIGHSLGTATFFAAMARRPEWQPRIRKMIALAPGAHVSHVVSPLVLLARAPRLLKRWTGMLSKGRIIPSRLSKFLHKYAPLICSTPLAAWCQSFLFLIGGFNPQQYSTKTMCMILGHTPSGASGKTLLHFMQMVRPRVMRKVTGTLCDVMTEDETLHPAFQEYDYGCPLNLEKYNSTVPPKYDLTANKVDTLVLHGTNDWIVQPVDAIRTCNELGNAICLQVKHYNHLDFLYAKDAKSKIYEKCIKYLSQYV